MTKGSGSTIGFSHRLLRPRQPLTILSDEARRSGLRKWSPMNVDNQADALVFFGATGDLAYKQIFPALQALVKRHNLTIPIIGVAKAGWTLDQLKARALASVTEHGGVDQAAFAKLSALLQYVDGDYREPATYTQLRKLLGK